MPASVLSSCCWKGQEVKRRPTPAAQLTPKGDQVTAPRDLYPSHPELLIVLFDLCHPNSPAELHNYRAALADYADIEALSEGVFALIIRPGYAAELAA
jgi:hypothetical protein